MKAFLIPLVMAVCALPLAAWAGPVDINSADASTLARELNGIGLARAQAIVEYREKNGPFKQAEDLTKIKGIGLKVIERNRDNIQLGKTQGGKDDAKSKPKRAAKPGKNSDAESHSTDSAPE